MIAQKLSTVKLFDLEIVASSKEVFEEQLLAHLNQKKATLKLLFTPNPEQVVQAEKDPSFKKVLQQADWLIPDGEGLVWASQCLMKKQKISTSIEERIAGADVVKTMVEWANEQQKTTLVIGGFYDPAKVENDIENHQCDVTMTNKIASVQPINLTNQNQTNWLLGYQNISQPTQSEEEVVKKVILDLKPEIVWVAFGAPAQEKWLVEHRSLLAQAGVKVGMAVGGSFDFLTGKTTRAPAKWQKYKLEWLYRLIKQPWRWRRQVALLQFIHLVKSY